MLNAELYIIEWLAGLGYSAYIAPPGHDEQPDEFCTVERTGGGSEFSIDRPSILIQCWAETALRASQMAYDLKERISTKELVSAQVSSAEEAGTSYVPDPDGTRKPRYQIIVNMVTR